MVSSLSRRGFALAASLACAQPAQAQFAPAGTPGSRQATPQDLITALNSAMKAVNGTLTNPTVVGGTLYSPAITGGTLTNPTSTGGTFAGGDISGQHVTLNGTTYTLPQALALPGGPAAFLTASGSSQATATPVGASVDYVVGGAAGASLILVVGYLNARIVNTTPVTVLVYPPVGGTINAFPANAAVALLAGSVANFASSDGISWRAG